MTFLLPTVGYIQTSVI